MINTYETKSKLPFGQYLLQRMIHLCQSVSKGEKQISKNDAFEIHNDWISKNVYPLTECAVAKKIRDNYETLMALVRYEHKSHKKMKSGLRRLKTSMILRVLICMILEEYKFSKEPGSRYWSENDR